MTAIHDKFEQQAQLTPKAIAVDNGTERITYEQLSIMSSHLALSLMHSDGIATGSRVGVFMTSTIERIVAIFAILKTGTCYIPIDPDMPHQYNSAVMDDCKPNLVLTTMEYRIDLSNTIPTKDDTIRTFDLKSLLSKPSSLSEQEVSSFPVVYGEQPAYIIYTSGSTGKPHGVVCGHTGLCLLIDDCSRRLNVSVGDHVLQYASPSFDASIFEIVVALFTGATLFVARRDSILPVDPLANFIEQNRISFLCLPPSSLMRMSPEDERLQSLKTVYVAGERCTKKLASMWTRYQRRLFNGYGPTEGTICVSVYDCTGYSEGMAIVDGPKDDDEDDDDNVESMPIGSAICGFKISLRSDEGSEVEPGQVGELYIAGHGVAHGYVTDNGSNKFSVDDTTGLRCFKTGDLARQLDTGDYVFVGRKDNQIKLNGYRIELEAIEDVLNKHKSVLSSAVVAREYTMKGFKVLVAFLVLETDGTEQHQSVLDDVKRHMRVRQPNHLQPHIYIVLDALPLASNGSKVDRKKLEIMDIVNRESSEGGDCSATEKFIMDVFQQILGCPVSVNDSFFAIGGTSLLAAELLGRLTLKYGVVIPVRLLYKEYPSPKALARLVEGGGLITNAEDVDYKTESQIDEHIKRDNVQKSDFVIGCDSDGVTHIFFTGGTGFLGGNLLFELASDFKKPRIYALARADSDEHAKQRIKNNLTSLKMWNDALEDIVVGVSGDVSLPYLGLSKERYEHLASICHVVYHSAADISYVKPYAAIKASNVDGTHEMLRFTVHNKVKPFHFVSSISVYGPAKQFLGLEAVSEDTDTTPILDYLYVENGYVKTKWISDKMVETAIQRGVPAKIYRPGFIEASTHNGISNTTDFMCRFIKGCIQMKMYPDMPTKYWMLTNADYIARAISHISMEKCHRVDSRIFNLVPKRMSEPSSVEIFEHLTKIGYEFEKVPLKVWLEEVQRLLIDDKKDNAMHPIAGFIIERVFAGRNTILELHHNTPDCLDENADAALEGTDIKCAIFDEDTFRQYTRFLINQGWLEAPPTNAQ